MITLRSLSESSWGFWLSAHGLPGNYRSRNRCFGFLLMKPRGGILRFIFGFRMVRTEVSLSRFACSREGVYLESHCIVGRCGGDCRFDERAGNPKRAD